jgi:hypothetical protein
MPLGITSKLFLNAGLYGVPVWVTVDLISDLKYDDRWNQADSSVRRARLETMENTNRVIELTGKIRKEDTDPAFVMLRAAFVADTVLDVLCLNGPSTVNGSEGTRFDARVANFSEDQGLQAVIFKEFTIKPCASVNLPQLAVIVAGVITYTPFSA